LAVGKRGQFERGIPTPDRGRTWPGSGWAVGKMWAIRTWHLPRQILVVLGQVQAGQSGNVGNSIVAFPTPNPGRAWPGAGWSVGKMWAIRTWHLPRRILVVLGQVQAGPSGKCGQFERGISHAESWSYLAMFWLGSREYLCNSNVASPMPNPGRTWPGAGWSVGKMWAIRTWHVPSRILVVLGQVQAGRRENVGNSIVAFPTPNPGRTWPGAGWAVGKTWAIRTWHPPRPILVVLGQVQAGPSGKRGQFDPGIPHAQSWSYLARCRLVRRENVGNSNVASPMPNPGRTWPGAGWSVGKMSAIRTWHLPRRILVVLGHVLAGQSGIFCNSNVASPMPNPDRTWSDAGWSVGKMWAIRTWHVPRRILVVLGQVQAGRRENVGNSNVAPWTHSGCT